MITQFKNFCNKILRKKKPYVRFYSIEPGVLEVFPIIPSSHHKRKFTTIPPVENQPSVKSCPGIRKVVSAGWIVPAPADFIIKPSEDGFMFEWLEPWRFGSAAPTLRGPSYIAEHGPHQTIPLLDDEETMLKSVVKVQTPWRVETSDDILLLQLPVTYNNESRFYAATGFLDTRYGYNVNIQLFWKKTDGETLVRAGTPLCQFIPVSRKHLAMNNYDVAIEDANELDLKKEQAFVYAANCAILAHDNLSSRLTRSLKILTKYPLKEKP